MNKREQKKQQVLNTQDFNEWWRWRRTLSPRPANPYHAYMIDKSLRAKPESKEAWKKEVNRLDYKYDHPAFTYTPKKQSKPRKVLTKRKTSSKEKTEGNRLSRKEIVELTREYVKRHNLPMPKIIVKERRTYGPRGGSHMLTQSKVENGKLVIDERNAKMQIVSGRKSKAQTKATLYHELGHLRDAIKTKDTKEFRGKGPIARERQATKYAREEMNRQKMKQRAVGSWSLRRAFSTYQRTYEPEKVPKLVASMRKKGYPY